MRIVLKVQRWFWSARFACCRTAKLFRFWSFHTKTLYSVQLRYFMQRRRDCGQCPQLITRRAIARAVVCDRSIHRGLAKGNFAGDGTVQLFHNWSPNRYTRRYSAFRTRGRVVLRAGGGGQHVRDEFRRSCAGQHSGPRIFMAEPRRTPGMYIHERRTISKRDSRKRSSLQITTLTSV